MKELIKWGSFLASIIQIIGYTWVKLTPHEKCPPLPEPLESVVMPIIAVAYVALVVWGVVTPFFNKE